MTNLISSLYNNGVDESSTKKNDILSPNSKIPLIQEPEVESDDFCGVKSDFECFEEALAVKNDADRKIKVEQLVKDGLDINAVKNGKTILDVAIEKKYSSKVIELLINSGSKINTIDSDGCTTLHRSVKCKNVKIVRLFLETNKREAQKFYSAKFLPEFMIVHQIAINAEDKDGFTALDYVQPNSEIYTLLKEYGAQHSKKFLYFCKLNVEDSSKFVSDNDYCFDILAKALEIQGEPNRKEVNWLLENNANVTKNNKTLLSVAAENGNVEAAVLLLKRGMHEGINSKDSSGRTLLLNAIIQNKLDCAEYLIERGICVTVPDNNGNNALHYASANFDKFFINSSEVYVAGAFFENLAAKGVDLYAKNNDNLTPFECVFRTKVTPHEISHLFRIYLEKGNKNKNARLVKKIRFPSGETLLEYFINNKLFDGAQSCISLGANINQPLNDGSSLLTKALQNKNMEGIGFLLKNGARINSDFSSKKRNNNKLYLKIAVGCVVMFSLGMGVAATFTLLKMSFLALAVIAVASLLTVVASVSLLILYKKIKAEKSKSKVITNSSQLNINVEEAANNLFSELGTIPERAVEAGALYLEIQKSAEKIAEKVGYKQKFIEARFQNIQENLASKLSKFQLLNDARGSNILKQFSAAVKDILKIYSEIPISNSHLLSLSYHLSWEVLYAVFHAITDPTLASTVLTAIRERRWPEGTQWSEVLRNSVPKLMRNQEAIQNVIVPTLTELLKNLSESKEERKFIIYTLVCIKEAIDEVYTTSMQESLYRILGAELANSVNNIAIAVDDLLNSYEDEEVERAETANKLDYLLGKLDDGKILQLITYLKQEISSLTGFQGKIKDGDKQLIRELVDYCLDPEPNDASAAKTLLNNIFKYISNDRMVADVNGNLPNTKITTDTTQQNIPLLARFGMPV